MNQIQLCVCLFFFYIFFFQIPLRNYLLRTSSGFFPSAAASNVIKKVMKTASFIAISDSAEDHECKFWKCRLFQDRSFAIKTANLIEPQYYNKPPISE